MATDRGIMSGAGYKIVLDRNGFVETGVSCSHGPSLLFERLGTDGSTTSKFYACSACRNRKECTFYVQYDKKLSDESIQIKKDVYQKNREFESRFVFQKFIREDGLRGCIKCGLINTDKLTCTNHNPELLEIDKLKYCRPSSWLPALTANQTNAQYFFKSDVLDLLTDLISTHKYTHVICIGTPSIHEQITLNSNNNEGKTTLNCKSWLLDIDVRMRQFHTSFAHYNMFNHHYFSSSERESFVQFIRDVPRDAEQRVLVIIDPPYGGILEAIKSSLMQIKQLLNEGADIRMVLFFPYYLESQVIKYIPELHMTDYKVDYSNHSGYDGQKKSRGSPARIFTDISEVSWRFASRFKYNYCSICERNTHPNNHHCKTCNRCTTKDGATYIHCTICNKCRKSSWKHCTECNTCVQQDHICSTDEKKTGCRRCGSSEHNLKKCPIRSSSHNNKHRKKRKT